MSEASWHSDTYSQDQEEIEILSEDQFTPRPQGLEESQPLGAGTNAAVKDTK